MFYTFLITLSITKLMYLIDLYIVSRQRQSPLTTTVNKQHYLAHVQSGVQVSVANEIA